MLFLVLTALTGLTSVAFAATPAPLLCGTAAAPVACDKANDVDGDGYFTNAIDPKLVDCNDDPATNWLASRIFPGAPPIIGDATATDTDCDAAVNGADEPDELAAVEAAAGAKWSRLERWINLCVADWRENADGDFVWGWANGGYTCILKPEAGYAGWSYDRESGVKDRSLVVESRRRIAGDAAGASRVDAVASELGTRGTPAVAAVAATATTAEIPAIPAVPGTGLYGELEAVSAAMVKANDKTRASLEIMKEDLETRIGQLEAADIVIKAEVVAVRRRVEALEASRPIVRIGGAAFLWGGASLLEGDEEGSRVRSGIIAGPAAILTLGVNVGAFGNGVVGVDVLGGAGGTGSYGQAVGGGAASAGIFYQRWGWVASDIGIGPMALVGVNATGNFLDSTASGLGGGGGVKASIALPSASSASCATIDTTLGVVAENYGANDEWFACPAVVASLGVSGGTCPR